MDAQGDCDQIQAKLDEISFKRHQAIAWALAKIISEDDLKMQLAGFEWQAASLKRELAEASLLTGNREAKLRAIADDLRSKAEAGHDLLTLENPTAEQQASIFDFKRTIIQGLVTRIDAQPDKTMKVTLEISEDSGEDLSISEVLSKSGATQKLSGVTGCAMLDAPDPGGRIPPFWQPVRPCSPRAAASRWAGSSAPGRDAMRYNH